MIKRLLENYHRRKILLQERGLFFYLFNNKGYILLIVLIISAFMVAMTSDFFLKTHTYISYIKRLKSDISAEFFAISGFEIAKAVLEVDKLGLSKSFMPNLNSDRGIDSYKDIWALNFPELPIDDYTLKIEIVDENSKINVSSLANDRVEKSPYYNMVQRLLTSMGLPLDIADALVDWVDPDDIRFPYGAETSSYYFNLSPPYTAKNGAMDSVDELLLVKGITPEIYYGLGGGNFGMERNLVEDNKGDVEIPAYKIGEIIKKELDERDGDRNKSKPIGREKSRRLSDYLTVYGQWSDFTDESNKININTASYRVLSALSDYMSDDVVSDIIVNRQLEPFQSTSEIANFIKNFDDIKNLISVKSYIFRIKIIVKSSDSFCSSVYYYDRENKKILYCSTGH